MNNSSQKSLRLEELDGLISLAVDTDRKLQQLIDILINLQYRFILTSMVYYIAIGAALIVFNWAMNNYMAGLSHVLQIAIIITSVIATFFFARFVVSAARTRRRVRHESMTEQEIQTRLVGMIYDQLKIVQIEEDLTPVSLALLEMRIKRLQASSYQRNTRL